MNGQPLIRPFREADWPAVKEICELIWGIGLDCVREERYGFEVGGKPWQDRLVESLRESMGARPQDWFVTELDGHVIGFCALSTDTSTGIGQVCRNGIHPDYAGKGHGSRQLRFVWDEFRRRGMRIAEVHTGLNDGHAPARKMYERAGFERLFESRLYTLKL